MAVPVAAPLAAPLSAPPVAESGICYRNAQPGWTLQYDFRLRMSNNLVNDNGMTFLPIYFVLFFLNLSAGDTPVKATTFADLQTQMQDAARAADKYAGLFPHPAFGF